MLRDKIHNSITIAYYLLAALNFDYAVLYTATGLTLRARLFTSKNKAVQPGLLPLEGRVRHTTAVKAFGDAHDQRVIIFKAAFNRL